MTPEPIPPVKEESDKAVEDPIKLIITQSEADPVKVIDLPCKPPVCVALTTGCVTEEEKIQEYLNRSDTAVIYPEPVSDREGEEEEEEEDSNKNDIENGK